MLLLFIRASCPYISRDGVGGDRTTAYIAQGRALTKLSRPACPPPRPPTQGRMRAAGFGLAFAGAVLQAFGMLIQKMAQNGVTENEAAMATDDASDTENDDLAYLSSRTWRAGFGLYLVGAICCFLAVGL